MPAYCRNRPTKAQVDQRDHNRRVIDDVRAHNQRQAARVDSQIHTIVEESLADRAVQQRISDQLDGHASRFSDEDAVRSMKRSIGEDNLRVKP